MGRRWLRALQRVMALERAEATARAVTVFRPVMPGFAAQDGTSMAFGATFAAMGRASRDYTGAPMS